MLPRTIIIYSSFICNWVFSRDDSWAARQNAKQTLLSSLVFKFGFRE